MKTELSEADRTGLEHELLNSGQELNSLDDAKAFSDSMKLEVNN